MSHPSTRRAAWSTPATYQSRMRPTKGEMRVAPTDAAATAWAKLNSSVMLQWMPSASRISAAWQPSQVVASLMSTRSRDTPAVSYISMMRRARLTLFCVSKLHGGGELAGGIQRRLARGNTPQARVHLRRHVSWHHLQDLQAEVDGQPVQDERHFLVVDTARNTFLAGAELHSLLNEVRILQHSARSEREHHTADLPNIVPR